MKRMKYDLKMRTVSSVNIGGLVGVMTGGTIENSSFTGTIIVEASYDDYCKGRLKDLNVGGIAGRAKNATFANVRSDAKIYIKDSHKFAALEAALQRAMEDKGQLQLAKMELEGIKSEIGEQGIASKIERFLNIVNGVRDVVEPFVPYLMSLV